MLLFFIFEQSAHIVLVLFEESDTCLLAQSRTMGQSFQQDPFAGVQLFATRWDISLDTDIRGSHRR